MSQQRHIKITVCNRRRAMGTPLSRVQLNGMQRKTSFSRLSPDFGLWTLYLTFHGILKRSIKTGDFENR